jgi:hypothetical protein
MIDRKTFAVLGLALASLIVLPNARASESRAKLTFSQSIQIPGQVLPAGTYLFVTDFINDPQIVRILSQDRSTCYATVQTIPAVHLEPSNEIEITFADRESMGPEALVTWFYPGRTIGHTFVYSKQEKEGIAQAKQRTVSVRKEVTQAKHRRVDSQS